VDDDLVLLIYILYVGVVLFVVGENYMLVYFCGKWRYIFLRNEDG
jgi:hypothetical protein